MVLAKSMDEVKTVTQNAVVVIAILGILALGGSFFMGYYFTQRSLNPINSIISLAERTTLHRMEKKAHIEGHPEDEFVRLADTFNRMLERLDEMSRRQREFVANASHELKTPLTRAITTLDVMQSGGPLNPEDLSLVKEDLMQINELIERLLALGKINEGQLPAGTSSVRSVIAKIRDQMAKELQDRNLIITPSQEENLIINLPQSFAEIIFSNVLSNAIKYSPAGSEITIHINKEAKTVTVTDKGAGMTVEEKTRVFDRFFRGKESRQTVKGYGLGLNLVKQICDVYGIQIEVRSEKGMGSSFIMHF